MQAKDRCRGRPDADDTRSFPLGRRPSEDRDRALRRASSGLQPLRPVACRCGRGLTLKANSPRGRCAAPSVATSRLGCQDKEGQAETRYRRAIDPQWPASESRDSGVIARTTGTALSTHGFGGPVDSYFERGIQRGNHGPPVSYKAFVMRCLRDMSGGQHRIDRRPPKNEAPWPPSRKGSLGCLHPNRAARTARRR